MEAVKTNYNDRYDEVRCVALVFQVHTGNIPSSFSLRCRLLFWSEISSEPVGCRLYLGFFLGIQIIFLLVGYKVNAVTSLEANKAKTGRGV